MWKLESGCVERITHTRLNPIATNDGKLSPPLLNRTLKDSITANIEQHLPLKAVIISQPTELGSLYSTEELEQLSHWCHERGIALILDGARLPYAAAKNNHLLEQYGRYFDAITISFTKIGGFLGAAVIFRKPPPEWYLRAIKGLGHLIDCTWIVASQTIGLFEDGNILQTCRHCCTP